MQEQGPWLVLSALGRPEEEGLFVVAVNKAGPGGLDTGGLWPFEARPQTVWAHSSCSSHLQLRLLLQGLGDDFGCFHAHRVALQAQSLEAVKVFNLFYHILGCQDQRNEP